jgi:hypothetical protein
MRLFFICTLIRTYPKPEYPFFRYLPRKLISSPSPPVSSETSKGDQLSNSNLKQNVNSRFVEKIKKKSEKQQK